MTTAQARGAGRARPTVYKPDGPKTPTSARPNPNKGRWGQTLDETSTGAVKKSQEAFDRAKEAKDNLPNNDDFKNKTASSDHVKTLSGWKEEGRPDGFQKPNVDAVLAKQEEIGHPIRKSGGADHGVDGQYFASHAERQLSLTAKEPHIGVSKACCLDCKSYFSKLAQHENREWHVTDPKGTWIFRTDGTIDQPQ